MTKTQAISQLILKAIAEGKDVREAVNSVLGEGVYESLAGSVYETLNRSK
jgi:hypothetical protein